MTFQNIVIFDLDGTTIDSTHRQATLADGTLNLAAWKEAATPEKIFQDQILPLGHLVSKIGKKAFTIICTARQMSDADFEFLMDNGICVDKIISRPHGNNEPDAQLKKKQLNSFLSLKQFKGKNAIMFDDADSVRKTLRQIGITVIHPNKINERIA
jgi:phosphoglycolate phosphatase-like HAD superfamily hydrolase